MSRNPLPSARSLFFGHPDFKLRPELTRFLSLPVGASAGALQGATGMSGPLVSTYLHGFRLDKAVYLASITTLFLVFSLAQIAALAGLGLYTRSRLVESLFALLPMTVLPLGTRLARRLSPRIFEYCVLAVLLATAVKMTYDALATL
ncbi:MAG: TSUP family transporter [Micromonosporaceae bacterium]